MPVGIYPRKPLRERFFEKVDLHGPVPTHQPEIGACWIWTGAKNYAGYGLIRFEGKLTGAHRVAFALAGEPLPECALHRCDITSCVRRAHLFAGTIADNNADMIRKGRAARGERCGAAKLTAADVLKIRERIAQGHTQRALATEFGVSQPLIGTISRRLWWRHI